MGYYSSILFFIRKICLVRKMFTVQMVNMTDQHVAKVSEHLLHRLDWIDKSLDWIGSLCKYQ